MSAIDKSDVKLGFSVGIGLVALGMVLAILQYILMRIRQKG